MLELLCLCVLLVVGAWVIQTTRRRLFTEPDTLAEDLAAFAGMPLAGEERRRVAEVIQLRHLCR